MNNHKYNGDKLISADKIKVKQLELAIPTNSLTSDQVKALEQAIEYAKSVGIDLKIVKVK